jgi:phage shock protein PspC (stress-responsive transcriptional regulator)
LEKIADMSSTTPPQTAAPGASPLVRPRRGRWLGGVCLAIAQARHLKLGWVRAAFVLATALGGLGAVVYVSCWLIVPSDDEPIEDPPGTSRRAAVVAQACAACVALAAVAALGAMATVFGFGWVAAGLAAAVLGVALLARRRLGPAWALLPIAALTLPSLAIAAAGLRLAPQAADTTVVPRPAPGHLFAGGTYRSGLGTLLVDLRRTPLPSSGTVPVRIEAGVRRTIVALPHDRCVHVDVAFHVTPLLGQLAALVAGRDGPFSDLVVFGGYNLDRDAHTITPASRPGPTLRIDFSSMGGSLYVRDYPDAIQPQTSPSWPGFQVSPEPPPDTTGETRRVAAAERRSWRIRRREQLASKRHVDVLLPGPCAPPRAPEAKR